MPQHGPKTRGISILREHPKYGSDVGDFIENHPLIGTIESHGSMISKRIFLD